MARSPIREKTIDLISDDGSILVSVAEGEQVHVNVTLGWLTNLTGYTITAKVVEANNVLGDLDTPPTEEEATPVVTSLTIIDDTVSDNQFKIVIPSDLSSTWATRAAPDDPTYGYLALSVADTGVGSAQQVFVPLRGLVEVRYNPVETS
jgi:hypothetical protein